MNFKKAELLEVVKRIMPGIGNKSTSSLEGSDTLIFDTDWVRTFNGVISISYPFKSNLQAAIKAEEFYKYLSKVKVDEIELILEDGICKLSDTKSELGLVLAKTDEIQAYIQGLNLDSLIWKDLPNDFSKGLDLCKFSVANDITCGALVGIYIGENNIFSSDNQRASWYLMNNTIEGSFVLPIQGANELSKYKDEFVSYSINNNWVNFLDKQGVILSSRILPEEYPVDNLQAIFSAPQENCYKLPEQLKEVIERVSLMSYQDISGSVYINISRNKNDLICKGEKAFGYLKEKIKLDQDFPEEFDINISPTFLNQVLTLTSDFSIEGKKLLFSTPSFKHVLVIKSK